MNNYCMCPRDKGPDPYATNIERLAMRNQNFRAAVWTGCHLQMTAMSILPCDDIGLEMHEETDQFIRIEKGVAVVEMGNCKREPDFRQKLCEGDSIFVPAGTWHNIINIGRIPLKISSIYAPPNHKKGTVHPTKADAKYEEY